MLRLKSGDVLWGAVESHAPEELRFRRLDTGGVVRLPWSFLDPEGAEELRLRFGYVDSQREELLVDAERIVLSNGTEVIGLIERRTDEHLWVKRAMGTIPVPVRSLRAPPALVRVPALDVYTREELYQQKAAEHQADLLLEGLEGAEAHDELARFSERLSDYAHAAEHYRHVASLAPDYDAARVREALARSELRASVKEQSDHLAATELWSVRKRYDRALESLEEFPRLYPKSPLMEDWNELRRRIARDQEEDLREEIVRLMHSHAVKLARSAARRSQTYEDTLAYLDETMAEELVQAVLGDLGELAPGIDAESVQRLWSERSGGRFRQASFGIGTWLLGESRALETYDDEEESALPEAPRGSQREAREKLEERVRRYLRNQELARSATGGGREDDPAAFWNAYEYSGRYQWILAYFAEFSGLFRVERVRLSNCRECGGSGARDVVFTGSAIAGDSSRHSLVPCPTCHTIGRVRRIRYR